MDACFAGLSLRTLCLRQLSKTQASPAAMWTLWSAQWNRTSGLRDDRDVHAHAIEPVVFMSLCVGTAPPPSMRIRRERDQTVPKDASTC